MPHVPVMLRECLDYLNVRPDGVYLDVTAGLGGHAGAIARQLAKLDGIGKILACDRDAESLELARANTADCAERIHFHQVLFLAGGGDAGSRKNYTTGRAAGGFGGIEASVDGGRAGVLADGGRSAGHAHVAGTHGARRTAADIVNFESEKELARTDLSVWARKGGAGR